MQCDYFDAGACRSCTLMGTEYAVQLADKQARVAQTLAGLVAPQAWDAPQENQESGFRNKAKLVVGGRRGAPTVGILDARGRGVDLRGCGLYEPGLSAAVRLLPELLAGSGLTPYDVPGRQGELKHVLLTRSPDDELMVRFVLRSPGQRRRVQELLPVLRHRLPGTRVVSVNLQPGHRAVLEGPEEEVLTADPTLPMRVDDLVLHLRPRSFFQTSTPMAAALYRQARAWIQELSPAVVWDLFCGVGGFALNAAAPGRSVLGVELSEEAVLSARTSAAALAGTGPVRFEAGDATAYLSPGHGSTEAAPPDLVVVNPPRRGIGPLAAALQASGVPHVLYSSCSADSLARDLAGMPGYRVRRARLFDMFPQTTHAEILVELVRR
ncbi:methyltransferase domain-containing protein [Ornithinimicrobium sp. W1665]|uniref:methyltransferase domain-containing protein n=1 Tax=Ornithinimicrobium sp. W1665 TaxID=3416666 RepID=UPI003CEADD8E